MRTVESEIAGRVRRWSVVHGLTHRFAPRFSVVMPSTINPSGDPALLSTCGAWLGQSWRGDGSTWPPLSSCGGDLIQYGDHVIDVLLEDGLTPIDIVTAAAELFAVAAGLLPSMVAMDEKKSSTAPPPVASTPA